MTEDAERDGRSGAAADTATSATLSLDAVLEVLADRTRRFALYSLSESAGGVTDLRRLVEEVVTLEAATGDVAVRRDRYVEVATDLYHWHLPVLADVGVVDFDGRHETIRYVGHPRLETWLDRLRRTELAR